MNQFSRTKVAGLFLILLQSLICFSQNNKPAQLSNEQLDSIYISETEDIPKKIKLLHAEPLYIDLIRDLGARKGEKEWNIGLGLTDNMNYDSYLALVEYEWAPADRLGFEVELPFSLYYPTIETENVPQSRLNSIKLATQYTFLVSEKMKTSLALGYIHEFEMNSFNNYGKERVFTGNLHNPFFVAAKRWGKNWHSLLYTGPQLIRHFDRKENYTIWQANSNIHYMITGTRNFVGLELNKEFIRGDFDMTIRPQMRLGIADNIMIGIVTGIPVNRENQRFSTFIRLIYEPGH